MNAKTDKQQTYREQLVELIQTLQKGQEELREEGMRSAGGEASGNLSSTPFHLADLATDQYEHEMTLELIENRQRLLNEINEALNRLDSGTYGTCERCGQAIGEKRLDALPYARHCITCAEEIQRQEMPQTPPAV